MPGPAPLPAAAPSDPAPPGDRPVPPAAAPGHGLARCLALMAAVAVTVVTADAVSKDSAITGAAVLIGLFALRGLRIDGTVIAAAAPGPPREHPAEPGALPRP
jgi:hypothetical protein